MAGTVDVPVSLSKAELLEQANACTPGGVHSSLRNIEPRLIVVKAEGAYLFDIEGKRYLDYHAAFGPPILGHSHPAVRKRLQAVIEELDLPGVGTTVLEIELAGKVVRHVPSVEKVLFCNSGSEATYHALRLARAVTGCRKIVKFQGCYHGFHDAVAMNVITPAERMGSRDVLSAGAVPEVVANTIVCDFNELEQVEEAARRYSGEIAAIILEPIPHNIGCVLPEPGFLEGLREIANRHGILLIFDEVITGFRHGLGGYQKIAGVLPDLTTFGKAMANGYPIAAVGGRADLMDRFNTRTGGDVFFAGTYNGHPIGCAAALATIEELEKPGAYEHLFTLGERMRTGLGEIMARHGIPSVVAGFGSVFLTYFLEGPVRNYTDLLRNDAAFFIEYRKRLVARGIYKLPMNLKRNHVSLAHSRADIEATLQACEDAARETAKAA